MHSLYSEGKKHFYCVWPLSEKNCGTFEIGGKNITSVFYKWIKQCNVCDFTDQWAELLYSGSFEESRILNPLSRIPDIQNPGSRIQDPGSQNPGYSDHLVAVIYT